MKVSLMVATAAVLVFGSGCSMWNASYYPREAKSDADGDKANRDDARDAERLTLSAGGYTFRDVRLDGARAWGPSYEVAHFVDGYRGDSPYGFLFLSEKVPGQVSGVTGNGALTNLAYDADRATGELHAKGRWAWKDVDVVATRDTITVTRAFCSDTYRRVGNTDAFVGRPRCWQAGPLGATLHVPDAFFARPAGEQLVFLTMFLA